MATVPGRSNVVPMMPEWAKPTQADFLHAAAIMHERDEQQRMADAGTTQPPMVQQQQKEQQPPDSSSARPTYKPGSKPGWYHSPDRDIDLYYDESGHGWLRRPGTH